MIYDEDLEVKLPPAKTYNVMGKIVNQEKFEINSFYEYLRDNYSKELADRFLTAMAIGISDTAHYELFIQDLVCNFTIKSLGEVKFNEDWLVYGDKR